MWLIKVRSKNVHVLNRARQKIEIFTINRRKYVVYVMVNLRLSTVCWLTVVVQYDWLFGGMTYTAEIINKPIMSKNTI